MEDSSVFDSMVSENKGFFNNRFTIANKLTDRDNENLKVETSVNWGNHE